MKLSEIKQVKDTETGVIFNLISMDLEDNKAYIENEEYGCCYQFLDKLEVIS